jgi:4'-phosphopantetheinyl transferase EntD
MIGTLLPATVATAEAFGDDPAATLFAAEEATLARAVDKRRREFTTGRVCAHRALATLGVTPVPILPGERREPLWPPGVIGSITHCDGYRAAAVARTGDLLTVGIDAEPNAPTPPGVIASVALPAEREMLDRLLLAAPTVSWDRLLFSAKESVYKSWYPMTRRWLGFEDAELTVAPDTGDGHAGGFTVRLLVALPPTPAGAALGRLRGRFLVQDGLIVTAIAL